LKDHFYALHQNEEVDLSSDSVFEIREAGEFIYVFTFKGMVYLLDRATYNILSCENTGGGFPIQIIQEGVTKRESEELGSEKMYFERFLIASVDSPQTKQNLNWKTFYHVISTKEDENFNTKTTIVNSFETVNSTKAANLGSEEHQVSHPFNNYRRDRYGRWAYNQLHALNPGSVINGLCINNNIAITANNALKVKVCDLKTGEILYSLTGGSKFVKTYESHPEKPGISDVSISDDKILLQIGNIMRVYSFDAEETD
jgi:hypothetical protein